MNIQNKYSKALTLSIPNIGGLLILLTIFFLSLVLSSCEKEKEYVMGMGQPIVLSVSGSEIVLTQKQINNSAVSFSWTKGTNMGTESSISYTLEIDKESGDFSSPVSFPIGKATYEKKFTHGELNAMLLKMGAATNIATIFKARILADVAAEGVETGISTISFSVTPYLPVSTTLFLLGSATSAGWDAANAIAMSSTTDDPTTFTYKGSMFAGELKFITTKGQLLPSYQMGANNSTLVYRSDESQADNKFTITEAGKYLITLNLVDLTINMEKQAGPAYEKLYLVGDATPNGWDIGNATEMTQDPDNLFKFTYKGVLKAGDFKLPVNRNTDWGQDMFMMDSADSSKVYLHHGGDSDDSKWKIYKENYYTLTVDLEKMTISIEPLALYMVGSATSIDWDITSALELIQDATNWYIFTWEGPLKAGEFKFPVNRSSSWGQNMYMRDPNDATKIYLHTGGASDDSKWTIAEADAGNYKITVNVQDMTIDLKKK
jgi:starch-binding outer membrane protein SusE/F